MRLKSSFLFLILFFLLFPFSTAQAASLLDVVINEIAWMGTKVEGIDSKSWWRYEWLELYNNTNSAISLEGWRIELYRTELDWNLVLRGEIPAKSYFLIVASNKISPNYDLNYSSLNGKFNNGGQKIILKDNSGNTADEIDCFPPQKWFAGDNTTKQTMERKNPQISGDNPENWQTSQNSGGTPKMINGPGDEGNIGKEQETSKASSGLPEKTTLSFSGVVINEILPSPAGPDETGEWIEIFNQNNFEVDLSGWAIRDAAGKTTSYILPKGTKILAGGFLVLAREISKITLNNDGDGVSLTSPAGNIIDQVNYEKAPQGKAYNRANSNWTWSNNLTPGATNIVEKTEIRSLEDQSTSEARAKKELAAIGEQTPKSSKFLFVLLIALAIAIFSGIMMLILKKKLKPKQIL